MSQADDQPTLARFASVLASLRPEQPMTARLCEAGRQVLESDGAVMTLDYTGEGRLMVHATDEISGQLDDLQDVVGEGPSFDAANTGKVVVARLGNGDEDRWALFSDRLREVGFVGTMVAVPLRAELSVLGVLSLHRSGHDHDVDVASANALGIAIGTAILQDTRVDRPDHVLSEAWAERSQIHQATGMIVAQAGVRTEDALALLRGRAFARNETLVEVARDVLSRRINFRDFTIEGD